MPCGGSKCWNKSVITGVWDRSACWLILLAIFVYMFVVHYCCAIVLHCIILHCIVFIYSVQRTKLRAHVLYFNGQVMTIFYNWIRSRRTPPPCHCQCVCPIYWHVFDMSLFCFGGPYPWKITYIDSTWYLASVHVRGYDSCKVMLLQPPECGKLKPYECGFNRVDVVSTQYKWIRYENASKPIMLNIHIYIYIFVYIYI